MEGFIMTKYRPLTSHLRSLDKKEWHANFSEITKILGFDLPSSAYYYPAWWANQTGSGHAQSSAWQDAGWKTADLDLENQRITFRFEGEERTPLTQSPSVSSKKGMSIADAKEALAIYFGISEDQIVITING
jgi:hypothetical protein